MKIKIKEQNTTCDTYEQGKNQLDEQAAIDFFKIMVLIF
jgi:hypothetical protein